MKHLEKSLAGIRGQIADPRYRTPDAYLKRRELVRNIITELRRYRPSQETILALGEAKGLEWENPLLVFEEKIGTEDIICIPAKFLKTNHLNGETRLYFPAHYREFEEDGLKISCSVVEAGYTNDLHYHKRFGENVNVAKGSIFLTAFGPSLANDTMLVTGDFAVVPEKVAHNFKTKSDSIVFTEKLGKDSIKKRQGISEVNPQREMLSKKFEKMDGGEIEAYSRLSNLDHPHRLGFVISHSEKTFEHTMNTGTFYFCVEGSMLAAMKQGGTWKEKTADEGSMIILNEGISANITFSEGARVIYVAEVNV